MARVSTQAKAASSDPAPEIYTRLVIAPVTLLRAVIIAATALWIYGPALHGNWVSDDSIYLSGNTLLQDPDRLWKAWFQPGTFIEYYPLEQTVQWMQWKLWGENTLGYHLTNVILHILSAFLLWNLLGKFDLRLGWLGGLLFTVHPLMVESVAWMSELKNTLSLPPLLLAMDAWIDYEERRHKSDYLKSLAWFLVAMLCKVAAAPLAPILLLYAWWKRSRIGWRDLVEVIPFFIVAVGLGEVSTFASHCWAHSQASDTGDVLLGGVLSRFVLAEQCLLFYFGHFFWPLNPMPNYPQWEVDPASPMAYLPWLLVAIAAIWLWYRRNGWGRHALLGLGFFLISLLPYIGTFAISYLRFTWVTDHFMYMPIIGLIGLVVAAIEQIDAQFPPNLHSLGAGFVAVFMILMAGKSHWYAAAFTGDETFWTYAVDRNPDSWLARMRLGEDLLQDGEPMQAIEQFDVVLRLHPDFAQAYDNRGVALIRVGRLPEALASFTESLRLDPTSSQTHNNVGILLARLGHTEDAIEHFRWVLRYHPSSVEAHTNLGNALLLSGRLPEAKVQYQQALQLNPNDEKARQGLSQLEQAGTPK